MITNDIHAAALISPARQIKGRVELWSGSALRYYLDSDNALKAFTVTREAAKKFFGFGVGQKITLELLDKERAYSIASGDVLKVRFSVVDGEYLTAPLPEFTVSDVARDENTNALTVTGEDALAAAAGHSVGELGLSSYTVREFATAAAALLGLSLTLENVQGAAWDIPYSSGANFAGSEALRGALDAVAEVTTSIYFVRGSELVFRGLSGKTAAALTIRKADYTTLTSNGSKTLSAVCSATELGDNVSVSVADEGETQYLRNNPFVELRVDVADIIYDALTAAGGLSVGQYACKWRGNYLLEIGDKLQLVAKDNSTITSFYLGGALTYNGGLSEELEWSYEDNTGETPANPASLGETLKQTFARVDKANRQIELVAGEAAANADSIASLKLDTESISASVSKIERTLPENVAALNGDIAELKKSVEAKATPESIEIAIKSELEKGANKVVTSTGYIMDDEGFRVEKSGSAMSTQITDDGMYVRKSGEITLSANSAGVEATNLHANTYLIIGRNSRFEDYDKDGEQRTGCFWIGG